MNRLDATLPSLTILALASATVVGCAGCNSGSRDSSGTNAPVVAGSPATTSPTSTATSPTTPPATTPPGSAPPVTGTTITTFATGRTPSVELHVATTGDDTTGTGSAAQPFATLQRAAQAATPGTAIRIHPGTYAGGVSVSNLSGTPSAPIWIGGVAGQAKPVFNGGTSTLQLSRIRYVVVHDLDITGGSGNGINCDDGSAYADPEATRHVVLQNLDVHDIGSGGNNDGIKLSGLDDFFVLDCTIQRINAGSGIDMVGCHAGLIARTRLESTGSNAIQAKGATENVEIRWCTLIDPGPRGVNIGGSTGDLYFRPPLSANVANVEARNVRVIGNVIVRGDTPFAFVGAVGCLAAHNTVISPGRWLFRILQEKVTGNGFTFTEASNNRVENNVFSYQGSSVSTAVNIGPNTQPQTFQMRNNLYHRSDAPLSAAPPLPVTETGTVIGDPLFTAPASGNYALQPTSPARAAGTPQSVLSHDGQGTPFAPAPSIGAYEVP